MLRLLTRFGCGEDRRAASYLKRNRSGTMRTYTKNRRRTQLTFESLEGKTLLSTGSVMHHVASQVTTAPIVARAPAAFSGTLTGVYSNVHAPGFANILSYRTSGTLTGTGFTRLRGSLFARRHLPTGNLIGQLKMRNTGGAMILNVFRMGTPGTYSYTVVRARGTDTVFLNESGTVMITQHQTLTVPFFISGQATMTFTPG
jgi:hypothetical protein